MNEENWSVSPWMVLLYALSVAQGFMKGHLRINFRAESAEIYSERSERKN
jgi:hypothetical protein